MRISVLRRGPTGTILNELAEASFDSADCEVIFVRALAPTVAGHLLHASSFTDDCPTPCTPSSVQPL
jgi:hypothetical protein